MKQAIMKLAIQRFSAPEKQDRRARRAELPAVFDLAYWSRPQPTLIVDRNAATVKQLAEQLGHRGFATDIVSDHVAAERAIRTKYYRSIIVVIESDDDLGWEELSALRKRVQGSWIIVATPAHYLDAPDKVFRFGGDSLLATPISVENLIARLSAFSLRSRPA